MSLKIAKTLMLSALLIACSLPPYAAGKNDMPSKDPETYLHAVQLVNMGNYDEAIGLYSKSMNENPQCGWILIDRGRAYALKGDWEMAKRDFDRAEKMPPNTVDLTSVYKARAFFHAKRGETKKAIEYYTKALERVPYDDGVRKNRAIAYDLLGMKDLAQEDRDFAKKRILPNRLFKFQAGDLEMRGDLDGAIKVLSKGLLAYPVDSDMYLMRGDCYAKLKQYDDALKDFNKAIDARKTTTDVHGNPYLARGQEMLRRKKYNEAVSDLTKSLELKTKKRNDRQIFEARSKAYDALGKHALADADRKAVLQLKPDAAPTKN